MFKAGPVFSIHCECYHFETHTVTVRVNPPKKGSKGRSGGSKKSGKKSGGSSGRKVGGKTSHSKGGGHSNAPKYRKKKKLLNNIQQKMKQLMTAKLER